MEIQMGEKVGFASRFENMTGKNTVIKYMTDEVLLGEAQKDSELDKYRVVILDDVHERSAYTDVLFGIMKKIISQRRDFKLIVSSSTLNVEKFSSFFGSPPIFKIPGRTFIVWKDDQCEDYVKGAVKKALDIHVSQSLGDILIFMADQDEVEAACCALAEQMEKFSTSKLVKKLLILPFYTEIPAELQAKIFQKAEDRKCIVSTSIAETSLTIDGVLHIIDTGYCTMKVHYPKLGMDTTRVYPVSCAIADQRAGCASRTGYGTCYRLYSEKAYHEELLCSTVPEIQRTNLGNVVLSLKSLKIKNLLDFDFMDAPPRGNILYSMNDLWMMGALDSVGALTKVGWKMVEFPLDPPLAKMLLMGEELKCIDEVLTIVSMLSVPSVHFRPRDRVEESDIARKKLYVAESDHLSLLYVYLKWEEHKYGEDWCNDNFLNIEALRKAREVRSMLVDIMDSLKIPSSSCGNNWDTIRQAICSTYFYNSAKFERGKNYVNCRNGVTCHLDPSSALSAFGRDPKYVVYQTLAYGGYMQCVTAVKLEWLLKLGAKLFSIQEVVQR